MTQITNFNFAFEDQNIITNLNLNFQPGQIYALLGSNGVGKTSVLNAIWQASFSPSSSVKLPTEKAFLTQDIPSNLNLNTSKITESFYDILWQIYNDYNQSNSISRSDFGIPENALWDWYLQICELTIPNFKSDLETNLFHFKLAPGNLAGDFSMLSPGTKKRILLAILFATKPKFMLIDELTNHLDKDSILVVEDLLNQSESSILMVDHNASFLDSKVKNWIYLPNNQERKPLVFYDTSFGDVMEALESRDIRHQLTKNRLQRRHKQLQKALDQQHFMAEVFNSDIGSAARTLRRKIETEVLQNPILQEHDAGKIINFKKAERASKIKKNLLLEVKNLEFKIGQNAVQKIDSFKLYAGQRIRIEGRNGRGKSSLLKFVEKIINLENLTTDDQYLSGKITAFDLDSTQLFSFKQVSGYNQKDGLGGYIQNYTNWETYRIPGFLARLELSKFSAETNLSHLSLGEFIRLQIGLMAENLNQFKLIILDEPGNFLDVFTRKALFDLLPNYHGALLLVTHDDSLAEEIDGLEEYGLL